MNFSAHVTDDAVGLLPLIERLLRFGQPTWPLLLALLFLRAFFFDKTLLVQVGPEPLPQVVKFAPIFGPSFRLKLDCIVN